MTNARPFKPFSKKDEDEKPLQTPVFAVKYNMGICAAAFIPEREAFERDPRNRRRGNGIFNGKKRYACKGSRKSAVQAECSGAGIHNFPHRRSRNFFCGAEGCGRALRNAFCGAELRLPCVYYRQRQQMV